MDVTVTASVDELNALLALLDRAVKACGLEVAGAAVHWEMKVKSAAEKAKADAEAAEKAKATAPKLVIKEEKEEDAGRDSPL